MSSGEGYGDRSAGQPQSESSLELSDPVGLSLSLARVLESAARLQRLVPDAVLVGGSAAGFHARHRDSDDHDHVLSDLDNRFDMVLDALEREPDWVTNRATAGKIVLGELGGIEAGVRQMIRRRPLDVEEVRISDNETVRVPTASETLRIKAFLIVRRNQMRDYLDVAALSAHLGTSTAARTLADIDTYYGDLRGTEQSSADRVSSQLVRQLGNPRPRDQQSIAGISHYKGIRAPWDRWEAVRAQCIALAAHMLDENREE